MTDDLYALLTAQLEDTAATLRQIDPDSIADERPVAEACAALEQLQLQLMSILKEES